MEKCEVCHQEGDLDWLKRCEPCFRRYIDNVQDPQFRLGVMAPGYTVTAAHLDDIRRRKFDSDGKVYRDRGRKSVGVGSFGGRSC